MQDVGAGDEGWPGQGQSTGTSWTRPMGNVVTAPSDATVVITFSGSA